MKKILVVIMTMLFCFMPFAGCANNMDKGKQDVIREISFSPDGKKLIFDRRNAGRPGMIHVYDLATGELSAYQTLKGERWFHPRYSFDGKHIVFIKMPLIDGKDNPENTQIAIMDSDGKNAREITNTKGFKVYPSFSHSGKKIIFARPDVLREKGSRTPAADYDVYEVDVETGQEARLTHFRFYEMSRPYYFPDDKTFVFWGDPPLSYPNVPDSDTALMKKICRELRAKYQYNSIYVMQANANELKPYLVMPDYQKKFKDYVADSESSRLPSLSADGSVLVFMSIGYRSDGSAEGYQLYQYSADGNHRRITHLPLTSIISQSVSSSGEQLAVVYGEQTKNKIIIYQVKDGKSREITLPTQPSRIINQK
jgi:Tol biopolymer transport system component